MKVLVTPRSFAKNDPAPLEKLQAHGVQVIHNPVGGILTAQQMQQYIADCDGVIVGVDPLDASVLQCAPQLRAVAKYGVGVDNIDLAACQQRGIAVSRTVGANSRAVADYAFALMLSLARKVGPIDRRCRRGDWTKTSTDDVAGKRLGLIGMGAIGREMVSRARGFAMEILAHDTCWDDAYAQQQGIQQADVDTICSRCDFISLHLPLTPQTKNIIGAAQIERMQPGAYLINTARGGLIDEDALLEALQTGRIAGAGLDAFAQEPPENPAWFALDNVVLGSHCAASTGGAAHNMSQMATDNLLRDLQLCTV